MATDFDARGGPRPPVRPFVRPARPDDLPLLPDLERAAGEQFRGIGMAAVADDDPPTADQLRGYLVGGRVWVAVGGEVGGDGGDVPLGYLLLDAVPGAAFVEQVSVHPACRGRRIGAALLDTAAVWARERELPALVLTTFADVPWNAPYYRRLGFRDIPVDQEPEWLRAVRRREHDLGLDAWPRVSLQRPLRP